MNFIIIKNNYKFIIGLLFGIIISIIYIELYKYITFNNNDIIIPFEQFPEEGNIN